MERTKITLLVTVELDGTPGTFHTPESARESVQKILNNQISHYCPTVELQK